MKMQPRYNRERLFPTVCFHLQIPKSLNGVCLIKTAIKLTNEWVFFYSELRDAPVSVSSALKSSESQFSWFTKTALQHSLRKAE